MQKTQTITLNLADNFNIFEHTAELKCQGFMLLSYLLEHKEKQDDKIKFKNEILAAKLKIHVSTLRRWLKKLIQLNFVTADKKQSVVVCNKNGNQIESSQAKAKEKWVPDISTKFRDDDKSTKFRDDDKSTKFRDDGMGNSAERVKKIDPLEDMLDNLCRFKGQTLEQIMSSKGVEVDVQNKPELKRIMLANPSNMADLITFYKMFEEVAKASANKKIKRKCRRLPKQGN